LFPSQQVSPQWCHDAPTTLPHVKQSELWDCGIACLQMIMAWIRPDRITTIRQSMLLAVGTESIWSIDLIYLLATMLHEDEASFLLCSKTLGVDARHGALRYYQKAFSEDEVRLSQRFQEAARLHWPVLCLQHISMTQVLRLISRSDCVAIVLLDNSILRQKVGATTYAGHYVLLCGISYENQHLCQVDKNEPHSDYCMVIKNPAKADETSYISPSRFEEAWRATGTDDDVLFVVKR
jgi:Guanylylate cyclase